MRRILSVAALLLAIALPLRAGDKSGPKIGDAAPTFDVEDLTGPHKGKTLCYV